MSIWDELTPEQPANMIEAIDEGALISGALISVMAARRARQRWAERAAP